MTKKCNRCEKRIKVNHFNRKYCEPCRAFLLRKPKGTLTEFQKSIAKSLVGKVSRDEIALMLGTSTSNLKRSLPGISFVFHNKYVANPKLVNEVCIYYEKHGKKKTLEMFPGINVRSIVERYKYFKPRQIRWTDEQKIELIRMACFVPFSKQAKKFNRPGARAGSIKSAWSKFLKGNPRNIHGLPHWKAKHFITEKCPHVLVRAFINEGTKRAVKLFLWTDMEKYPRKDCPNVISEAIKAMAEFQRWIYKTNDPRKRILWLNRQ